MLPARVIIVGAPRSGKSTLAREFRRKGLPTYCGDPYSKVKDPESGVTYLREDMSWSEGSQYVADTWFHLPGPWCCEGQVMARALRKWVAGKNWGAFGWVLEMPADRIIVFRNPRPEIPLLRGQLSMAKSVATVWAEIAHHFEDITEYR